MSHAGGHELEQIIGAIREVETNLDRRDARAYGAVLVMWALVAAGCFLYAYSPRWFPEHHAGHSAAYMTWFWTAPVALAGVVTLFAGARRWRVGEETRRDGRIAWLLLAMLAPVLLTGLFLLQGAWWLVAAAWVAWTGVYLLAASWRDRGNLRALRHVLAAGLAGSALYIAVARPTWAYLAAALLLLVALGGLGVAKYARGE